MQRNVCPSQAKLKKREGGGREGGRKHDVQGHLLRHSEPCHRRGAGAVRPSSHLTASSYPQTNWSFMTSWFPVKGHLPYGESSETWGSESQSLSRHLKALPHVKGCFPLRLISGAAAGIRSHKHVLWSESRAQGQSDSRKLDRNLFKNGFTLGENVLISAIDYEMRFKRWIT